MVFKKGKYVLYFSWAVEFLYEVFVVFLLDFESFKSVCFCVKFSFCVAFKTCDRMFDFIL